MKPHKRLCNWTLAEDNVIRELYPKRGGIHTAKHLPGRGPEAVRVRAAKLGVATYRTWTEAEKAFVCREYPRRGARATAALMPGRGRFSVSAMAVKMGLHFERICHGTNQSSAADKFPPPDELQRRARLVRAARGYTATAEEEARRDASAARDECWTGEPGTA
jgi:hypothetical protein